jgi:hypothetical protein
LSGKIETVDHKGSAVRAENRRARHDVKVQMRPGGVPRISQKLLREQRVCCSDPHAALNDRLISVGAY